MSNKHWIKGMRRRAAGAGHGRGRGNVAELFVAQERQRRREVRAAHGKGAESTRSEKRSDVLSTMIAQDRKRSERTRRRA